MMSTVAAEAEAAGVVVAVAAEGEPWGVEAVVVTDLADRNSPPLHCNWPAPGLWQALML